VVAARLICGVDEAGRGPLAGPVFAAAVVFLPGRRAPNGIADSKLPAAARALEGDQRRSSLGRRLVSVEEIDTLNILRASFSQCAARWNR
jgi:ribonuclease HII